MLMKLGLRAGEAKSNAQLFNLKVMTGNRWSIAICVYFEKHVRSFIMFFICQRNWCWCLVSYYLLIDDNKRRR